MCLTNLLCIQTGWCSILDYSAAQLTVINQQVWMCLYNGRFILFVQIRIQDYEISVGMSLTIHRKSQLIFKSGEKLNGWQYTKSTAGKVTHFWLLVIAS
jgi:hypothetical protein